MAINLLLSRTFHLHDRLIKIRKLTNLYIIYIRQFTSEEAVILSLNCKKRLENELDYDVND